MNIATKSFLRREEYKVLSEVAIDGEILDIGGSKKSGYHELIKGKHTIITGNIDTSYDIDIQFDAQKQWPFPESSFDGVLLVNVLEHLYGYRTAVTEAYRVLRPNGIVVGVVPFMFNVHGSPHDYFRFTKSALEQIFIEAHFSSVKVTELGTGGWSIIYHVFIGYIRWNWMARVCISVCTILDRCTSWIRPRNKMSKQYMPLGYYFEARKK